MVISSLKGGVHMSIGTRIMNRRKELGMTQDDLAKKMGYKSRSTINKIEMGINDISQSKVVMFSKVLDTTIAYLMGWDEEESITEEIKKDNDITTDIIVRMRIDNDFLSVVETLNTLDEEKFELIKQMLNAFKK